MTVLILRPVSNGTRVLRPREVVDLPGRMARAFVAKGIAEEHAPDGDATDESSGANPEAPTYTLHHTGAGWYDILKDGEVVESSIRGQVSAQERIDELTT